MNDRAAIRLFRIEADVPLSAQKLLLANPGYMQNHFVLSNGCRSLAPLTSATRASTFLDFSELFDTISCSVKRLTSKPKRT